MSNDFKIYDIAALVADLPEHDLLSGQVGIIADVRTKGEGFETTTE